MVSVMPATCPEVFAGDGGMFEAMFAHHGNVNGWVAGWHALDPDFR